ncbi:response regulator [Phenylobacterium sp. J367]|uniref:response regulator n=1 Tax=Phenylobacterium sp. J367 TaxID=2898435 RepID=UPI002151ABDF|nr:response regulator [Phenylobacterium sp. J367]MCR5878935.1 response regulator [Phenylobacterium sp. J367]
MVRVLLVEDEADVREVIEEAFVARGLDVRTASTDEEAYRVLKADGRSFGVLVADINLGAGTTGFDVARQARLVNPNLSVIYITGHAAHLDRFGVEGAVMFPSRSIPASSPTVSPPSAAARRPRRTDPTGS